MTTESGILLQASCSIGQWLGAQPGVKEESLTDWLLYIISAGIRGFRYCTFTRDSEGRKTGADWEWWIVFRKDFSFRLRIQAKKLRSGDDHYPSIAYANRHGLQIEMLLSACEKDKVNALPLYAFYTSAPARTMCALSSVAEGVFLAGARQIFNDIITVGRKRVLQEDLLLRTTPLSCLLGCPLVRPTETGLLLFLKNYYPHEFPAGPLAGSYIGLPGVHTELPEFVSSLLASEDLDSWESDFGQKLNDIQALAVLDLRKGAGNYIHQP